ncbi:hypothetical protein ACFE04_006564 [Oxalis oulophora]
MDLSSAAASFMSGERVVVVVFISRILFSLPLSLLPHGIALSLLALLALSVDILNSASLPFKLRPSASSGILLGAVTLPALMLSQLIQLSRAFAIHHVQLQELQHMTMQYWATSASCFAVLIFICTLMWSAQNNTHAPHYAILKNKKFALSCIAFYMGMCYVSLATISHTGINVALKSLWVLCHGVAAVRLIKHLLNSFPSCASIGEALLVTSGLVLYFGDMLALTIAKVSGNLISPDLGLLLGLLLFPVVFKSLYRLWECSIGRGHSAGRINTDILRSVFFFTSLGVVMIGITPSWMQLVQYFHVHPVLWVFSFVLSEPVGRLSLCVYWLCLICAPVLWFYNISKNSKIERILLRKYYHLLAVLMFLPALIYQPKFLDLAFGVALAVFLVLEIIRVWRIWPLGQHVHQFMTAFTDHRDSDELIVSHFSLLLGCALPIWMSYGFNDRPLAPFAGILSLGIGDSMASVIGHKYGVLRWSKTGKKTIEGTAAGITSVLATCSVLLPLLASTGYILTQHWLSLLVAVTVSGLLEAYTAQLDNAFIPLVFYSLLCL